MAFGLLERRVESQPMSDINVTPLVDVMLVLVVIFIITAPLLASSIRLDLPKSEAATASDLPAFVTVVIDKTGQVFLDDKPVDKGQLALSLASASAKDAQTEVQLRADAGVPYGRVVETIGIAQKAGLSRIGFVADPQGQAQSIAPVPSSSPKRP